MFKVLTKHLFGKIESPSDGELIVDGRIIDRSTGEPVAPKGALSESVPGVTSAGEIVSDPKPKDATAGESSSRPGSESSQKSDSTNPENPNQDPVPPGGNPEADTEAPPDPGSEPRFQGNDIPEGYQIFLGAAGKSERTINQMHASTARRKIAVLRSYARWLLREGYTRLHGEVGRVIPPKIPGRVPKDRGSKDFEDLTLQAAEMCAEGDRRGLWIGLMLCCGLRISEIKEVELTAEQSIRVIGKGNKERLLPAPKWLYNAIADKKNKTWRRTRQLIWLELKEMGVKKPHSLRHTYASELIRCGVPLEEVKELLGHSKLDTTLIYAKIKIPKDVTSKLGVEFE